MAEIIVDLGEIETEGDFLVRLYPAKGDKGDKGDKGEKGDQGNDGQDGQDGSSGGSPVVVDAVADMTDTTQAYLYVGEETGYTKGDWYYYDGTDWVSGGQYGSDSGINDNARNLLKYILERVAYTETGMQTYVNALYQALKETGGGGGTTTYSIINALDHVTNSNTDTGIDENESYSATLTADTDYTIDSVTVTMGGVDITATAYDSSDDSITIASVTGDIVITASATVVVPTIAFTLGSIDTSGAETVSTTRARSASIPVTLATPTLNSTVKAQIAGVVSASGLINNNATNRITTERLPVTGGTSFSASCASGYYLKAFVYSDTTILSNKTIGSFETNTISGTIYDTGTYLRIAFKRSDDGAITSSDFTALNLTINGVAHSVEVGDISVGLKIKVNATVNGVTAQYIPRLFRNGTYFPTNSGTCYDTDPAYYNDTNNSNRHYSVAQCAVGDNTEYVFETLATDVNSVRLIVRTANGSDDITSVAGSVFINDTEYQIAFS